MGRYLVEEEGGRGEASKREGTDGLTMAKALARKRSRQSSRAVVVRDSETGKVVARYEPEGQKDAPALVSSVQRMKAANDRLKEALVPPSSGRKKRA